MNKDTAYHVLDIVKKSWRLLVEIQKKLIPFLHTSDPQFKVQPVGALPVLWNNEVWLKKSRGV